MVLIKEPYRFYHKQHLVPFGEYVPLKSLLGGFFAFFRIPMANFSEGGSEEKTLPVAGVHAGISICYEDAFGEEVIQGMPKANLLVNVSNDAWFGESLAPHQHLQMAQMRSLETGRAMLRGTNNGISAIIDHHGDIIGTSPQFREHVLTADIQPVSGSTPYILMGNSFVLLLSLSGLLFCIYLVKRQH
jgi:apolipoprotein N-acyltransferase